MNKTTVKALSKALNITEAGITRYIRISKMVDELQKEGNKYFINEEQANKIVEHFTDYKCGCEVALDTSVTIIDKAATSIDEKQPTTTVVSPKTTVVENETTVVDEHQNVSGANDALVNSLLAQIAAKDKQIDELTKAHAELIEALNKALDINKALSAGNAATLVANAAHQLSSSDDVPHNPQPAANNVVEVPESDTVVKRRSFFAWLSSFFN